MKQSCMIYYNCLNFWRLTNKLQNKKSIVFQQNKGTKYFGFIKGDEQKSIDTIFCTLTIMKIVRIGKFFDSIELYGVNVSEILML